MLAQGKTAWIQSEIKARGRQTGDSDLTPKACRGPVKLTFDPPPRLDIPDILGLVLMSGAESHPSRSTAIELFALRSSEM